MSPKPRKPPRLDNLLWDGKLAQARAVLDEQDAETLAPQLGPALIAAVCMRNVEAVELILRHGADANTRMDGETPVLHRAAWEDPVRETTAPIVRLLLDHGASLEARDDQGLTPLLSAVRHCAKQGPAAKAAATEAWAAFAAPLAGPSDDDSDDDEDSNPTDSDPGDLAGDPAAVGADPSGDAVTNRFGVIDLLLQRGASLDERDPVGASPTLHAAIEGDHELIEGLVARGAARDGIEELALLRAASDGRVDDVARALGRGAEPNRRIPLGSTALSAAAQQGHLEIVDLLLAHGADPNLAESDDANGDFNPLFSATYSGHLEVVRRLLAAGADPAALGPGRQGLLSYAKLGSRESFKRDQPWEAILELVRGALAGAPPTVSLSAVSGTPPVLAALAGSSPELARLEWRGAKVGPTTVYESAPLDVLPAGWEALQRVAAKSGFALVLAGWSLDDVEPDLRTVTTALAEIRAAEGQALLDRLEAECRTSAEEWDGEDLDGEDEEADTDPFFAIEGGAPLPPPPDAAEISLSVRQSRLVLLDGPPEAAYLLYGGGQPDLSGAELAAVFACWRERVGAVLAAFDGSTAELVLPQALRDEAAIRRHALDLYAVAPDLGESAGDLLEMAASRQWHLWWD